MTITIPTGDLTGVLGDTIPFASPDDEVPQFNCVRLEWDGDMLHALSADGIRVAWSQWHPDDEPEGETQDDLFTEFGGADDPWAAILRLDDAKEMVETFKLGPKEQRVPLTVDCDGGQITVKRSRDTGYSAHTLTVPTPLLETPDVRKLLADLDHREHIGEVAFTAKFLADFGKVRPRGPLEFTFTGATKPTLVRVGKRFCGAIMPVKLGEEPDRQAD